MNTYKEAVDFLMQRLPMFSAQGAGAIKPGLDNILALCAALDNPQQHFPAVHIAGTNGKGSTSHMLAAVLQEAGYKTGLYTSPHIVDFAERIKVNGVPVAQDWVVDFVARYKELFRSIEPSFFEVTVAMAFQYFAAQQCDIAIIETGLGGRLDSTNIITPVLSVITNISLDHTGLHLAFEGVEAFGEFFDVPRRSSSVWRSFQGVCPPTLCLGRASSARD